MTALSGSWRFLSWQRYVDAWGRPVPAFIAAGTPIGEIMQWEWDGKMLRILGEGAYRSNG